MEWSILLMNFSYALVGSFLTLIMMIIGYKLFDKITPFNTHEELTKGNMAVGIVVAAILIGLGVAVGMVIGMGLN